jgi:amino acid transporter
MANTHSTVKRFLVGRPLATSAAPHERVSRLVGLAIFSSDAVASSAFATQEILHVLVPVAGMAAIGYLTPMSLLVVALLAVVVFSCRQTIHAYPNGGGSYIVSKDNLGTLPGLAAGASLLVDYTLTVAVSIAAGTAAITSAISPCPSSRWPPRSCCSSGSPSPTCAGCGSPGACSPRPPMATSPAPTPW